MKVVSAPKREYLAPLLRAADTEEKPIILSFGRGGMGKCGSVMVTEKH